MKIFSILIFMLFSSAALAQTGKIAGSIKDQKTQESLVGANIELKEINRGTTSDENGEFELKDVPAGNYTLSISYMGYEKYKMALSVKTGQISKIDALLRPSAILGKEVIIVSTRATEGETPAAFLTLKKEDIQTHYYAQDVPALLSELPSTTFYSENGNGIGYNYLSIRGFGQRRISVMINGVPQNDPEDHNVYWLDFPDLLGNVQDVQVQRGAGSAFYGPPAIGGSVNIVTSQFSQNRKISFYAGQGTYNTQKYSLSLNSGLIHNQYVVFGRFSRIKSDGYREQSWTDFKSYFIGAARFGKRSSLRLHFYGGPVEDHLAYYGISKELALDRSARRQNPIQRPDEIENFNQPHLELIHEYQLTNHLKVNNTLFAVRGFGFFDYDGSWAPMSYYRLTPAYGFDVQGDPGNAYAQSILIRAYVDNRQAGWMPQLQWTHARGTVIAGSEIRFHRSLHWGRIQKGSGDLPQAVSGPYSGLNYIGDRHYYEYKGAKDIISPYVHTTYRFWPDLMGMFDLQLSYNRYRLYDEKFLGNDFSVDYYFLNPRAGLNYILNSNLNVFASYSRTSREPRLKNFYDAAEASTPDSWGAVVPQFDVTPAGTYDFNDPLVKPETLHDFEIGMGYNRGQMHVHLNLFYMNFKNEIIKNGQLDRFGQPRTGNADRTLHTGVELALQGNITNELLFSGNFTYSKNELKKYGEYVSDGTLQSLDGNPIAGFPDLLGNTRLTYRKKGFAASVGMQHVGKQHTDNYRNERNTVDPYTVFNGMLGYTFFNVSGLSGINFQFHIQNIFDTLYITHGEGEEFFPAAERQIFLNMKVDI
ncbi:MAG: TonB-dependent receptor [Calditrichia bacterium]